MGVENIGVSEALLAKSFPAKDLYAKYSEIRT
jgi:hypothetical protein